MMTLRSVRIGSFAGDVTLVFAHMGRAIQSILTPLRRWQQATSLALKLSKCAVVMGRPGARSAYEHEVSILLGAAVQIVDAAVRLGVSVGP